MTRKRLLVIIAAVAGVILFCGCSVAVAYMAWNTPLGPVLTVNSDTGIPTPAIIANLPPATTPLPLPTATQLSAEPAVNCGQSGSQNILVMGVDAPKTMGVNGPLAIRFVKIDFGQKTARVFSFPKDLWLSVIGLEGYGITQARLGEAYLFARNTAGYSVAVATSQIAEALSKNFGAVSNHYLTAKLSTLATIIDTVGGITVNIPVTYDGTPYGFHYFAAGPYYMSGALALEYAIAPSQFAQWSGVDRQTQVLMALYKKMYSAENISKLPSLIPQFLQVVTTDLSLQQISDLVCIFQQIPMERITVGGVGPNDVTFGAGGVLYPNGDAIRTKVQQFLNSK